MLIALILLCEEFYPFPFLFILFSFFVIVIVRQCLHSLNQEQFLIQTQWQRWIQQVAGIPRLPLKLLWSESADLKFSASTEEKRGQQESAEQRDHRLAQRRQHRQQEKEEQGTSIESGSITFSSQKPFTCIHDLITFYIHIYIHFLLCFEVKVQL